MSTTNIWLVFYTPPESEDERYLSAHEARVDAVAAAEADAVEQGYEGWTWRDEAVFSDFGNDDNGYYAIFEVPLQKAAHRGEA